MAYTQASGGVHVVARENFGPRIAQVAAVALIIDYIVTVAVQTAAGTDAVTSAFPGACSLQRADHDCRRCHLVLWQPARNSRGGPNFRGADLSVHRGDGPRDRCRCDQGRRSSAICTCTRSICTHRGHRTPRQWPVTRRGSLRRPARSFANGGFVLAHWPRGDLERCGDVPAPVEGRNARRSPRHHVPVHPRHARA